MQCFLHSRFLVGFVGVFGIIVMLEDPACFILQALTDERRCLPKITRHMAPSIHLLIGISDPALELPTPKVSKTGHLLA